MTSLIDELEDKNNEIQRLKIDLISQSEARDEKKNLKKQEGTILT